MAQNDQRDAPHGDGDPTMPSRQARQPQLNSTVCGCHCSCISGLFGSDGEGGLDSDADRTYWEGEEGAAYVPGTLPPSPLQSATTRLDTPFADFELSRDGFQFGSAKIVMEHPFRTVHTHPKLLERVGSPDSLVNHMHSSDEPSLSSSGVLTRRSSTPGPVFNSLGTWTEYHFTAPPLPLAPQWQIPSQAHFQHISQNGVSDGYPESIRSEELNDPPV